MIKLSESMLNDIMSSIAQMEIKKISLLLKPGDHTKKIEILDIEIKRNQVIIENNEIKVVL